MTRLGDLEATPAPAVLAAGGKPVPGWLPAAVLALLVLPFHPYWIDFELARRGLLLALAGTLLLLWPSLPRVRGEGAVLVFLAGLAISAVISVRSLQPWEAVYRIAHWVALWALLRLGAAQGRALASPLASLLLLTCCFGLAQRAGIAEILGYGVEREPVSVFGNLNVAAEFVAVAAAGTAALITAGLATARPWLSQLALLAAGAYLVVNGSRSGLIALPIALVLLPLVRRRAAAALPLVLALLGALLGLALNLLGPVRGGAEAAAVATTPPPSTLEVRWELAKGSMALFAERPLFGFGPGQFQVQYPRVRTQREIDLSSNERQFATEVRTAHDDWLELLVEGGLPLWLLFAAMVFALQRGKGDKALLLPLLALLLLMFARAPLGNAPAIAVAMLLLATRAPEWRAPRPLAGAGLRLLGLSLLALGTIPVLAQTWAAPYVAAKARGEPVALDCLQQAQAWMPFEPRFLHLLAQEHLALGDLAAARRCAARACQLRPHDPHLLLLLGEVLARGGAYQEALAMAQEGLAKDPGHPELKLLQSTVRLQQGDVDGAVQAIAVAPHKVLREQLANHFRTLARLAGQLGQPAAAARCEFEQLCLDLQETLGRDDAAARVATDENLRWLLDAAQRAGIAKTDLRPYLLNARHFQAQGDRATVDRLAAAAERTGARLPEWQRALCAPAVAALREEASWANLLR